MSDPSPSPSHDVGVRVVSVVGAGEKMLVEDGLAPVYSHDSFKVLGVEGGQFVKVGFSHRSAL